MNADGSTDARASPHDGLAWQPAGTTDLADWAALIAQASLDVDSENPTGALALYTTMGYVAVNRSMAWDKEL
jgi:hypothetical protein